MIRAVLGQVVCTCDVAVFFDDDYLDAGGVADSEGNLLLTVRGDGHARQADVSLAGGDGFCNVIELHVVNLQLQAQLFGDGRCDFGIDACDLAALYVFIGRESGIGGHGELALYGGGEAGLWVAAAAVCRRAAAGCQGQGHGGSQ